MVLFDTYINSSQVPTLMAAATPSKEEKMFLWPEAFTEPKPTTIQEGDEGVAA